MSAPRSLMSNFLISEQSLRNIIQQRQLNEMTHNLSNISLNGAGKPAPSNQTAGANPTSDKDKADNKQSQGAKKQ